MCCYNTSYIMRELPSQVKGAGFRVQFRRNSCVRIAPLAYYFVVIGILDFLYAFVELCITRILQVNLTKSIYFL